MHHTYSLTVELQRRKIDILESIKQINLLKTRLNELRESVDDFHDQYYNEGLELCRLVGVEGVEHLARLCKRQTMRANYPVSTTRDYYRVKLTIPLLDYLIDQIEFRFPSKMCDLYRGFYVVPGVFLHCEDLDWKTEFMKFVEAYREDMPKYRSIHAELGLWETSWRKGFEEMFTT